ncbi:DUF87 domain-containing protein, partial [Candidatus Gracilibacteria bacterium]|nr:DUF87 domain-containing protein [Candidatus Gracilibacteria bacterium]
MSFFEASVIIDRESFFLFPLVSIHTKIITYEVAVDRANEKGVFVAREMLSTLHHSLSHRKPWWYFSRRGEKPFFRFQILSFEGRIRFFFSTSPTYASFLTSQLYAHYPDIELKECVDILTSDMELVVRKVKLAHHDEKTLKLYVNLKDRTEKDSIDPLSSLTSSLVKIPKGDIGGIVIDFSPLDDHIWRTENKKMILSSHIIPHFFKPFLLHTSGYISWIFFPIILIFRLFGLLFQNPQNPDTHDQKKHDEKHTKDEIKTEAYGYGVNISLLKNARESMSDSLILNEIGGSFNIYANPQGNYFQIKKTQKKRYIDISRHVGQSASILNTTELAGIVHLPTLYVKTPGVNWVMSRKFEVPHNLPNMESPNTPIGVANFRGNTEGFGIKPIDRARHVYIIGKTGMGKSTLLENMIYTDILNGRGVAVIDPHGDLVETILANIPKSRTNDIVLFDPADQGFPIGFNMLDNPNPELRPIVAGGLVSIFKKMFAESWGPRLEYILRNTILTLLQVPDTTLISIPMILTHESYRNQIVSKIKDPILVQFWTQEFGKMTPANMTEAVSPILNKVGQFLSSPILRNILGQPKNPFSLRWIMDNQKIFLVNL